MEVLPEVLPYYIDYVCSFICTCGSLGIAQPRSTNRTLYVAMYVSPYFNGTRICSQTLRLCCARARPYMYVYSFMYTATRRAQI